MIGKRVSTQAAKGIPNSHKGLFSLRLNTPLGGAVSQVDVKSCAFGFTTCGVNRCLRNRDPEL